MRAGLALLCLCSVAVADPSLPASRPPPKNLSGKALEYWARARLAEKRGRLGEAYETYMQAGYQAQDADAAFNAGILAMRVQSLDRALTAFSLSLKLSPDAAKPKVQALINDLRQVPPTLTIGSEVPAIVVLDHAAVGAAPLTLRKPPGNFVFEVFSRDGFGHLEGTMHAGEDFYTMADMKPNTGNVYLSGMGSDSWTEGKITFKTGERFTLPVGAYATARTLHGGVATLCEPIRFEVKSTTDLTYVHVERASMDSLKGCFPVAKVTQRVLKLP